MKSSHRWQSALKHLQAGRLPQAEALCQRVLKTNPGHPDALHLLGVIAHLSGKYDIAVELFDKAIAAIPDVADYYNNCGEAYRASGQPDLAMVRYEQALGVKPDYAEAHNNLGLALKAQGRLEDAKTRYRQALAIRPNYAEAHNNLGLVCYDQGRLQEAVTHYMQALALNPGYVQAHNNLGLALQDQGRLEEAITHYQQALALKPGFAEAHNNLGNALQERGGLEEAINHYEQALALKPDIAEVYNNLGNAHKEQGRLEEAMSRYLQALALKPDYAEAHNNLALVLKEQGRPEEAIARYEQALILKPDYAKAHNNLGNALSDQGRLKEAICSYQRALSADGSYTKAFSNLLFLKSYHTLESPARILDEHQQWDLEYGEQGRAKVFMHSSARIRGRRLRVGYVSPDFRHHAVAYFFEPILQAHSRSRVEVFCYAQLTRADEVSERIRALADHWRPIAGQTDRQVAEMIHADGIDILVDLAGHTRRNRLKVFTYKPAPIQATYLGYFNTTGLAAMDYWISDELLHPPETVERSTETILRLPRCWVCYRPSLDAPPVATGCTAGEGVTFGSFNNLNKISPAIVALWSRILASLPEARLLLKTKLLASANARETLYRLFADQGIGSERLSFKPGTTSYRDHLTAYGEVDIALDPFPCSGGTTTADALWMGVPVISLAGERFIERMSMSVLTAIGETDWIASTPDEYVDKAVALARDQTRRQGIRSGLRQQVAASPLCDAAGMAHALEDAYEQMWRDQASDGER